MYRGRQSALFHKNALLHKNAKVHKNDDSTLSPYSTKIQYSTRTLYSTEMLIPPYPLYFTKIQYSTRMLYSTKLLYSTEILFTQKRKTTQATRIIVSHSKFFDRCEHVIRTQKTQKRHCNPGDWKFKKHYGACWALSESSKTLRCFSFERRPRKTKIFVRFDRKPKRH